MKAGTLGWIFLMAALLLGGVFQMPVLAEEKSGVEDAVAVVNDAAITRDTFNRTMDRIKQRMTESGRNPETEDLSRIEKEVLEQLIGQKLIHLESRKKGFSVKTTEVDAQLQSMKSQFPSEAAFKQALERMGFLDSDLAPQIRERMEVQKFIDAEITGKISVPESDVQAFYDGNPQYFKKAETVKASHILIKVSPDAEEGKKKKARDEIEGLLEKVKSGADFAALAKSHSQGPSNVNGGDLGFFGRGQMVKPFENAAFALKPGEVSGVIETRFGLHIIKVFDKKPETKTPYKDVKARITEHLRSQTVRTHIMQYVENLKKTARIDRRL